MAKTSYQVPVSLNRSFLDFEIPLSGGGFSLPPTPIKQLLFIGAGILLVLWACTSTFIGNSGLPLIIIFVIWSSIVIFYFGGLTKTKELRIQSLVPLLNYVPQSARVVTTRRSSNPSGFHSIVGIRDISNDGTIFFNDGGVGQMYLVVGSASYLLFEDDRVAILDRVDAFWRKIDTTCQWAFITTKESQRIYHQVANLERRNQNLEIRDPDLIELQNEQYDILTEHVGGQFTSIHQYLLVKGTSEDSLRRGHKVLQAEVESSSLMIRELTLLDRSEVEPMLAMFYQGVDTDLPLVSLSTMTDTENGDA